MNKKKEDMTGEELLQMRRKCNTKTGGDKPLQKMSKDQLLGRIKGIFTHEHLNQALQDLTQKRYKVEFPQEELDRKYYQEKLEMMLYTFSSMDVKCLIHSSKYEDVDMYYFYKLYKAYEGKAKGRGKGGRLKKSTRLS